MKREDRKKKNLIVTLVGFILACSTSSQFAKFLLLLSISRAILFLRSSPRSFFFLCFLQFFSRSGGTKGAGMRHLSGGEVASMWTSLSPGGPSLQYLSIHN
jgi:hypothetical protein